MKITLTIAALMLSTTAAFANGIPQQIDELRDRIEQVNREDQRAVSGTLNAETGVMTIVTQDMAPGKPGKSLSPRSFDVDLSALQVRDGKDGADGIDGHDGQDFDAAGHAATTALAGLQYQSLSAGETGWSGGIGGQLDGDAAIAVGINHGLTDTVTLNGSIASAFDGNGVSAFIGASGKF